MQDKTIKRNIFSLFVIIMISTIPVTGLPVKLGQDAWISLLLAIIPVFPLLVIYSRSTKLMPERDIFGMAERLFGKIGAGIAGFLFFIYFIYMTSFIIYSFTELIHLTSLFKTPMFIIMIILILAAVYLARSGLETMAKWAFVMLIVISLTLILTSLASVNFMDFGKLFPVMEHYPKDIIKGSFKLVSYPFGEAVILLIILAPLKGDNLKPFKISILGIFTAAFFISIFLLRTITVLGPELADSSLFAVYKATSIVKVGNYLQRLGSAIEFIYVLAGMVKIAVYLYAAGQAVSRFVGIGGRKAVVPVGVAGIVLSLLLFGNNLHIFDFYRNFIVFSIPFQIIIPVFIWIWAEIKLRRPKTLNKEVGVAQNRD